MHRLAILAAGCLLFAGCTVDELVLSPTEQQDLVDNFEASIRVYSDLTEFAFTTAMGQGDPLDYSYDAPSAQNGWIGTVVWNNAVFPSGTGDLTMHFSVVGDTGPVDPYTIDLSSDASVSIDADLLFTGTSDTGAPLSADADFTVDVVYQDGVSADTILNGTFVVSHNAYVADFVAHDFSLLFDLATEQATSAGGQILGTIDIPDFAFDAVLDLEGLGSQISTSMQVVGTRVDYLLNLADL